MKLNRLIIQGFKSFKDRTTIHFDQGITGIVGPNGCGKSNIVDALFWVMGEQSAKHLRGNTMKDVIFAGSSKFNPGTWAEATLVLENTEGKHIHIGNKVASPSEIQLTRKLYRNGETEYRINGQPCRLKDIQEVFMDTGAGAKSYSIIAQGEINRLVQAKPEERRTMIEEVAGITKFKMRKKESLRKIDQTESNLGRLKDLQIEIEKNLKSLQKQAEKAERARSLRDKVKKTELVVNGHKVFDLLKGLKDGKTRLNESQIELQDWATRKETLEVSLEGERIQREEKTEKIDELQKEFNEISRELAASEEKLNSLCKSITQKEELIGTREKELEQIQEELTNRKERLEALAADLERIESEGNEEQNFSDLEELVENLKEELELKKAELSELTEDLNMKKEELAETNQQVFQNKSRLDEFSANLQDITQEIEALENQYSGFNGDIAKERDEVNHLNDHVEALVREESTLRAKLGERKSDYETLVQEIQTQTKIKIETESRFNSLIEINQSLDHAKEGIASFMDEVNDGSFDLFGNIIQCPDEYSKAVQVILNEYLNALVLKNGNANNLLEWIKNNTGKGLDFLKPKNFDTPQEIIERLKLLGLGEVKPLEEIVQFSQEVDPNLKNILKGLFVVDELLLDKVETLSTIGLKGLVDKKGTIVLHNGSNGSMLSVVSEKDAAQGVIERNNKIEELKELFEDTMALLQEKEEKEASLKAEVNELNESLDHIRNNLADQKAEYAAKKSTLESKMANLETGNARLDILKNRKAEISKKRLDLMEAEEGLDQKVVEIEEYVNEKQEVFDYLKESVEDLESQYSQNREELIEKELHAKSFQERLNSINGQVTDVEGQLERLEQRKVSNQELIEKYNTEIEEANNSLGELEENNQASASDLQEKDDVLNILKDDLVLLLQQMQEREEEAKGLNSKINKTEKEVVEIETKLTQYVQEEEQIVRNIFEKHQVNLRDTIGKFLEFEESDYQELQNIDQMFFIETEEGTKEIFPESYEFTRRYGQDLKDQHGRLKQFKSEYARLGEINWQAIEDYERQKLRFDFLSVQEGELRQSLEDLQNAIAHIDIKSKERFKIAFEEVDTRFQKVFPIIFGGGSAKLSVSGDINEPECGVEIIAQPPGKKMQNINLMSGGEKALTAVSLIFSIFLVKPSPFCLLDEVDAPLDDANVGRFNELLREMSKESQFILITHNKKTMELNDTLYGVTMQEPGISKAVSVQLH